MARKRRSLHRRYRRRSREGGDRPAPRSNPPLLSEIGEFVLPGFGGFAASRLLTRMTAVQIAKRKPAWAKHAGVIASVGSFVAAWWGANRIKALEKYHTPIVVGSALAGLQSIIQLWIPQLGWMLDVDTGENHDELQVQAAATQKFIQEAQLKPVNEDPSWFTYDDKYDAGRYATASGPAPTAAPQPGMGSTKAAQEDALLEELGVAMGGGGGAVNMGIFN